MIEMAKTYGIISLVLGFISIMLLGLNAMQSPKPEIMIPALILSIVGIIFGGLGITKDDTKVTAKAGLFLGIIVLILPVLLLFYILLDLLFPPVLIPIP